MNNEHLEIFNALEEILIKQIQITFAQGKKVVTQDEARNILGKIGLRIAFGSKTFDKVY